MTVRCTGIIRTGLIVAGLALLSAAPQLAVGQCPAGSRTACAPAGRDARLLPAQLVGRWRVRLPAGPAVAIFRPDSHYVVYAPGTLTNRETLTGAVADTTPADQLETGMWLLRDRADGIPLLCVRPDELVGRGFGSERCAPYQRTAGLETLTWRTSTTGIRFAPYGGPAAGELHLPLVAPPPSTTASMGDVYFEFQVQHQATQLPGPSPRYPAMLRSADIEGEVLAQFVVDTAGRVEPGTFKVLKASHEGFAQSVRNLLPDLRYRPADIGDRKVRQMVQQPFTFSLSRE